MQGSPSSERLRSARLESNGADVADAPPVRDALRLATDPGYQLLRTVSGGQYFYIGLNTTMPPLDNKLVARLSTTRSTGNAGLTRS